MTETPRKFETVEEAISETVFCPFYSCWILPWRCEDRKRRAERDRWNDGDRALSMEYCLLCKTIEEEDMKKIDISKLDKAEVLAALYNHSKALVMGMLHYDPKDMTKEEAQALLNDGQDYFDYIKGRVMKIYLSPDGKLDHNLYDRDNGPGAAAHVIDELKKGKP